MLSLKKASAVHALSQQSLTYYASGLPVRNIPLDLQVYVVQSGCKSWRAKCRENSGNSTIKAACLPISWRRLCDKRTILQGEPQRRKKLSTKLLLTCLVMMFSRGPLVERDMHLFLNSNGISCITLITEICTSGLRNILTCGAQYTNRKDKSCT